MAVQEAVQPGVYRSTIIQAITSSTPPMVWEALYESTTAWSTRPASLDRPTPVTHTILAVVTERTPGRLTP
jgi:hypothetical protein